MSQVKIYATRQHIDRYRTGLSQAIHQAIVQSLNYPVDKKFQRFIALESEDFIFPADRSEHYTIIEISMFEGRSTETKRLLITNLFSMIEQQCQISPQDIEITIFETPKSHWGIRGINGADLSLGYKVE